MSACTIPFFLDDPRYVNCMDCTWHAPITLAGEKTHKADTSSHGEDPQFFEARVPCCPKCGGSLTEYQDEEFFWSMVRNQERECPGYEAMLRWSAGKSFPDFDTMQNAWRQAMEGQI